MEISAFPFTEESSLSPSPVSVFLQDSAPISRPQKRPRCDALFHFQDNDSSVQELLNKLLAFDTENLSQHQQQQQQQDCSILAHTMYNQSNQDVKSEFHFNDYYPPNDLPHSGNSSNTKRAFTEISDVVTTSDESTSVPGSQRRLWVKDRSKAWWDQVSSPDFPDEEFKKAFRMSRPTFDFVCDELESVVTKKDTMLRLAIPVRQRVAVCIWRLATGEALREVSKKFGLGISTCHKLVMEVCTAIRDVMMPKFLQWPDENRMREIKRDFGMLSGISDVGGSMYTTHIPIIAPKVNVAAYFNKRHTERNQKTTYSITVQGVVDTRGVFTDICIGWPGSMTDDQVLEKSAITQRANKGALKDVWVVGNSGYPLTDWVLVPYTHQNLTWTQHAYNEKVEEVQSVAKESFMRLKARWSCLQKRTEMKLEDLPKVLGACCVLHNICEMRNEGLSPELRFELFDDEVVPENNVKSVTAMHIRDQIAHKLLHHNQAGTRFM